jgi:hypothetical protein
VWTAPAHDNKLILCSVWILVLSVSVGPLSVSSVITQINRFDWLKNELTPRTNRICWSSESSLHFYSGGAGFDFINRNTGCPHWGFSCFAQFVRENSTTVNKSGHDRFLPNPLQFIYYSIDAESVIKQKVLGRTNRLLPFDRQGPHRNRSVQHSFYVRFEVFTAVTIKNAVFWDVAPCRSCVNRRFGGTSVHTRSTWRHSQEDGILQQFYCCVCICFRVNVFTEPLPSNDRRATHTHTKTDGRDLWSTPFRWALYTKFRRDWFTHSEVDKSVIQTHTTWRSHTPAFIISE